ncbi:hypothetical protein [Glacieibacterium frigidum]|uniref:hypothetical protein n=1 Tax=Glacieibacterium frigidum TaxID=2593303 RepID=UPI00163D41A0|nr:hypothetical protein [Glacieibacterium frigidum]
MKSLLIAALLALPVAAVAQDAAAPAPAEAPAAAPAPLPKCTAKVQDSCDQSATTEKNALPYYPADSRDAGNNKIAGAKATPPKPM